MLHNTILIQFGVNTELSNSRMVEVQEEEYQKTENAIKGPKRPKIHDN
jgi:hypothetical protein